MDEESKQLIKALVEGHREIKAQLDSIELKLAHESGSIRQEMREGFERLERSVDYLAGRSGKHEMEIELLKARQFQD
ncbi:hypothetical protein [Chengkuizengella axinellae]|uniref:Uncharacterized protein n=1 Tax=Chengkuizengella axinellae TaxID=3064388 RepID=A0ABT9J2S4_9BACL|nr:hypothetical protein [Chengkuizengella sp. 2205SS18-9]MDP5275892.1 hypothetical protein [Chengkuizengella sp. 2205SS18-9]